MAKKRTYKKTPKVEEVTLDIEQVLKEVVEEPPKKKTKVIRIGHKDEGWIWREVEVDEE
jgi:hypothetical protein